MKKLDRSDASFPPLGGDTMGENTTLLRACVGNALVAGGASPQGGASGVIVVPRCSPRRPRLCRPLAVLTSASLVAMLLLSTVAGADSAPVRLVRSTSGARGSVQGARFIIEDPRTTFYAAEDRQVVVYFEWDAAAGPHECRATWKDPSGAVVLISPYQAKATGMRLSVYWTLSLPEAPRLGLWAVQVEVDGQPAGVHTFEIQAVRGDETRQPTRRVFSPAELYGHAQAVTLMVEAFDGRGTRLAVGAGFLLAERLVATAFQVIEGAARVRVTASTGTGVETDELAAWNRRQDWAVLRTPPLGSVQLTLDRSRSWKVGDRCAFLDTGADGARVMVDTTLVGAQDFPQAGPRVSVAAPVSPRSIGAPLLNEYGEAIAVMGGALTPGVSMASPLRIGSSYGPTSMLVSTMGFPVSALPSVSADAATKLQDLAAKGVFLRPIVGPRNVLTGTIARGVEKRNGVPMPIDEKSEFSRSEAEAIAFLTFDPQEKREGMSAFHIYDLDNHAVMQSQPTKLRLRPREYSATTWRFSLAQLQPGTYRIELSIAAEPLWRTYFRVVD